MTIKKQCKGWCGEVKPVTAFSKGRGKCKQCSVYQNYARRCILDERTPMRYERWLQNRTATTALVEENRKLFAIGKKRCSVCSKVKDSASAFSPSGNAPAGEWPPKSTGGAHAYCKACKSKASQLSKRKVREPSEFLCPEPAWKGEHHSKFKALLKETW